MDTNVGCFINGVWKKIRELGREREAKEER